MIRLTTKTIDPILKRMDAVFGMNKATDQEAVRAYAIALGSYDRLKVARAVGYCIDHNQFYPRPAEIREVLLRDTGRWEPPAEPMDEAMMWLMWVKGYTSEAEITEADITTVYKALGIPYEAA